MKQYLILCALALTFSAFMEPLLYPIDGFGYSGIKRLMYWQLVKSGEIKSTKGLPSGALKSLSDIQLNLRSHQNDSLPILMEIDPEFQSEIDGLFRNLDSRYSISVLDVSDPNNLRFAERNQFAGYQPGSVGKLAVLTGFFTQLSKLYPTSFEQRIELMKSKIVSSGSWGVGDHHTIPIFDLETKKLVKRQVVASDEFTLFEWLDHMVSVSNNGAASIVWRESLLMAGLGDKYPTATEQERQTFLKETPKKELSSLAHSVVNQPLLDLGITADEWRLGSFFTNSAKSLCPVNGGSKGTTNGLMKWILQLEKGNIVDPESSLEMKRLLYMTDRRIRYAASPELSDAAVYFKSGSLYKCDRTKGEECGKYKGNVDNYMNSIAIVEHPDKTNYFVVLMSNVLRKNSASDHLILASNIDKIIRKNGN